MDTSTLSKTFKPTPDLNQESSNSRIIFALFEIESPSFVSWGSFPSLNNSGRQAAQQQTTQKFENLLKEIKELIKNVTSCEEITEAKDSSEETSISENVSELKEQIRELEKVNKVLLNNLLGSSDLEKEQNTKNEEMTLVHQNCSDMVPVFRRDLVNCLEENRALKETRLSEEKATYRFPPVQEENIKLRNNMEQLLQEAEHWNMQHTELSELIRSYQKSQKDIQETLRDNGVHFQTQPNHDMSAKHDLEEQVKKLEHDTYSLHLIAALLENECQILQQRIEFLKEVHDQQEGTLQEKPIQINSEQDKKNQMLSEVEHKPKMQEREGTLPKKDKFYRGLDASNKKALNNHLNTHIARGALVEKKRPTSSLS
ncbi:spermatogenic leucine zipper protein 1 [Enhydra lutris kenyoni]|uniref:Spermatogenic leucine zipper protein 1 n=1 Tax=Enhydra lutris kenyoni TaxID=391180 RepID=A0A2Y9JJ96_ENHLU|nr:spermatogenic leucine zipper protein 1 [Enhydra lutris kenyoni]